MVFLIFPLTFSIINGKLSVDYLKLSVDIFLNMNFNTDNIIIYIVSIIENIYSYFVLVVISTQVVSKTLNNYS